MKIDDLKRMSHWATMQIGSEEMTFWDWYNFMKLREALDSLIQSYDFQTRDLQRSAFAERYWPHLAVNNDQMYRTEDENLSN